jgi:glyoxylase-like metal-dependent hydrolase (beta-lactamase superfamily II)
MAIQLREHVWWMGLSGVNAYLADDDGTLTLIDAGTPLDRRTIERGITSVGERIDAVDRILLTHFDFDHVGTLNRIEALDAPIYVGAADEPYLTGTEKPPWRNQKGAFQRALDWLRDSPSMPVETVADGDEIGSFRAHHAPGHTPGHTVFVSEDLSVAFLGDLVREADGEFEAPPGLICYDHEQAKSSIIDVSRRAPSFEAACPGHGIPFKENGSERLAELAERIDRRRSTTAV